MSTNFEPRVPLGDSSILVVDDDSVIANAVSKMLRDAGATVHVADSPNRAIEIFEQQTIDVVLTDLIMEGADGLELMASIRSVDNSVSVIIMTSHASPDVATKVNEMGANGFLRKPFDSSTCVDAAVVGLNTRRKILGLEVSE